MTDKVCEWCGRADNTAWLVDYADNEAKAMLGATHLLHAWCVLEWKRRPVGTDKPEDES